MKLLLAVALFLSTSSGLQTQHRGREQRDDTKGAQNLCKPAFTAPQVTNPFSGAFCDAPEYKSIPLKIREGVGKGAIPDWLLGTLYRNVPSQFNFGEDQPQHLFDGMGQIQAFRFENSSYAYVQSKFMKTYSYQTMIEEEAFCWIGAYTYPFPGPVFPSNSSTSTTAAKEQSRGQRRESFSKKKHQVGERQYDKSKTRPVEHHHTVENNDVSLLYLGGRYWATTDAPLLVEWDGTSLETLTPNTFSWNDTLVSQGGPTHGQMDMRTKEYFSVVSNGIDDLYGKGKHANFTFWKVNSTELASKSDTGSWARTPIATVEPGNMSYTHSIGLTEHHVVWMENPLIFNLVEIILKEPVIRTLTPLGKDSVPMRIHTINRKTGETKVAEVPGFGCMLHTGNTFEEVDSFGNTIVTYDTVNFPECDTYDALTMEKLLSRVDDAVKSLMNGYFVRCTMNLTTEGASCKRIVETDGQGFPWWNKQFHMKPYRYAYTTLPFGLTTSTHNNSTLYNGALRKIDVITGETLMNFSKPGYIFTEALFVPKDKTPCLNASSPSCQPEVEDEGALLSVVYNTLEDRSEIWALDAKDLSPLFVVDLPFSVTFHFHGIFCSPEQAAAGGERWCLWN